MGNHNPDLVGEFIKGGDCPQCGCPLLVNKVGDKWCSRPGCAFGIEDNLASRKGGALMNLIGILTDVQRGSVSPEEANSIILEQFGELVQQVAGVRGAEVTE